MFLIVYKLIDNVCFKKIFKFEQILLDLKVRMEKKIGEKIFPCEMKGPPVFCNNKIPVHIKLRNSLNISVITCFLL
jgi:hypothetical protein